MFINNLLIKRKIKLTSCKWITTLSLTSSLLIVENASFDDNVWKQKF